MSLSDLNSESCPKQLTSSDNSEGTLVSKVPTLGQQVREWTGGQISRPSLCTLDRSGCHPHCVASLSTHFLVRNSAKDQETGLEPTLYPVPGQRRNAKRPSVWIDRGGMGRGGS